MGAPGGVIEATGEERVEGILAGMAAGTVAAVMAEGDGFGQGDIEAAGTGDGGSDLRHLERVGEPGALMILGKDEDLGLAGQPAERGGMEEEPADALGAFRACNYDLIYLRPASLQQGQAVISVLRALVEHFADRPHLMAETSVGLRPPSGGAEAAAVAAAIPADLLAGGEEAIRAAVTYVAGMTDRFAFRQAVALLGWDADKLPTGVDA